MTGDNKDLGWIVLIVAILLFYPGSNAQSAIRTYVPPGSDGCEGLNLYDTATCLRNIQASFHNYIISPDDPDRSFEDIINNGGDCFDYNRWYERQFHLLGYPTWTNQIKIDNKTSHVFLIAYDSTGYCLMDMNIEPACRFYKNGGIKNGEIP